MTTCNQVQEFVLGMMDDPRVLLSGEAERHLSTCEECRDLRESTVALSREYCDHVHAGINQLRRSEGLPAFGRNRHRPSRLRVTHVVMPLAALILLVGWGISRSLLAPATGLIPSALVREPALSPPLVRRVPLFDGLLPFEHEPLELSLNSLLPVRLDEEFVPERPASFEVDLPRGLRF